MTITAFKGEHGFLSNFHRAPMTVLDGHSYPTAEHAFQVCKTVNESWRSRIRAAETAGQAKRLGRSCPLREDWEGIKLIAMAAVLRVKFSIPHLRLGLLHTNTRELVEGNDWGDDYWGKADRNGTLEGANHLGVLLMKLRDQLRGEARWEVQGGLSLDLHSSVHLA